MIMMTVMINLVHIIIDVSPMVAFFQKTPPQILSVVRLKMVITKWSWVILSEWSWVSVVRLKMVITNWEPTCIASCATGSFRRWEMECWRLQRLRIEITRRQHGVERNKDHQIHFCWCCWLFTCTAPARGKVVDSFSIFSSAFSAFCFQPLLQHQHVRCLCPPCFLLFSRT